MNYCIFHSFWWCWQPDKKSKKILKSSWPYDAIVPQVFLISYLKCDKISWKLLMHNSQNELIFPFTRLHAHICTDLSILELWWRHKDVVMHMTPKTIHRLSTMHCSPCTELYSWPHRRLFSQCTAHHAVHSTASWTRSEGLWKGPVSPFQLADKSPMITDQHTAGAQ